MAGTFRPIPYVAGIFAAVLQLGCGGGPGVAEMPTPSDEAYLAAMQAGTASTGQGRMIIPQDLLQVTVFDAPELTRTVRVSEGGDVSLPLVGLVRAAGGTPRDLERTLAARLRTFLHEPHVAVEVAEHATQPVYVLGEVNQPGAFVPGSEDGLTILRAVSLARGFKPTAANRRTVVIRTAPTGERMQIPVDLSDVLRGRMPDIALQPNDVVYVPKNTERAVALGVVDALLRAVTFRAVF